MRQQAKKAGLKKFMNQDQQYLNHILKSLPHQPGVYKMKNAEGQIIYVGKAKDLKHRVSSYFQKKNDVVMRTQKMVEQIADIEYIEVGTELVSIAGPSGGEIISVMHGETSA